VRYYPLGVRCYPLGVRYYPLGVAAARPVFSGRQACRYSHSRARKAQPLACGRMRTNEGDALMLSSAPDACGSGQGAAPSRLGLGLGLGLGGEG
jgi:hypothetical protein